MVKLTETVREDDWKTEKHMPVIECPDKVPSNEMFQVTVGLGKEVAHPNTTEHHIRWISVYFLPEGQKIPIEVGNFEMGAHGESAKGPNEGPVYTHHQIATWLKTDTPGAIQAIAYCNIHGLWQSSKKIKVQEKVGAR